MSHRRLGLVVALNSIAFVACSLPAHGDLVGYWNFDGSVEDLSGTGNDGELIDATYSNNVPAVIGQGQSLDFEFDTDHAYIENADGDLDSEEFTLSMFVFDRGQVGALERLTSREGDTFETAINVHPPFNGTGEFAYYSGAGGGWQWGEEVAALEEWQHVAYVANADEETLQIYVDGELSWESFDPWITFPSGFMHIGNRHNNVEGFDGLIDDVAIWDEVLDPESIKAIAQGGVASILNPMVGDLNGDGICDATDIDLLANAIQTGDMATKFDVNADGSVDAADHLFMVQDIKRTWLGDSDLNGEFNSSDFVIVFQIGEYEDAESGNSTWAEGDWNGDAEFNSSDFVAAFQGGGFEAGALPATQAVPEPSSLVLLGFGLLGFAGCRREKRR